MRSVGLNRFLFVAALISAFSIPPAAGQVKEATAGSSLAVPGGLSTVADIIGLDDSSPDSTPGIERIFSSLLELERLPGGIYGKHVLRSNLISYLKQYSQFLQYLREKGLVLPAPNSPDVQKINFSLTGNRLDLEKTGKLLSFFGIECRVRTGHMGETADIEIKKNRSASKHALLYKILRINLADPDLREIHISLRTDRIRMILDDRRWERILSQKDSNALFQQFVENPDAMRLYLAFSSCSRSAREELADSVEPAQLLKSAEALFLLGSDLKFEKGTVVLPGSRQAWAGLPGSPAFSVNALLSCGGAPLLLYSSLSSAPISVQKYLTASPERLRSYFEILKPYAPAGLDGSLAAAAGQELQRMFRLSTVTPAGLGLALDERISNLLLRWMAPGQPADFGAGSVLLTPKILARLLPCPRTSPYVQTSRANILEFFRYFEDALPGSLSAESIESLIKTPEEDPVFLDIIGDLNPDPALLSKYLRYCAKTASSGAQGWNMNRTRTSQSIFFLLSALRREGGISQEAANRLLNDALEAFRPVEEGLFAFKAAEFLTAELMPEVSRNPHGSRDALLSALSGNKPPRRIIYNGRGISFDLSARKYRDMEETIGSQSHTPISTLLDIYALLKQMESAEGNTWTDGKMRLLSKRLSEIRTAERTPGNSKLKRDTVAQIQVDEIKRELTPSGSWADPQITLAVRARAIAAQIDTELGITLLAYCYAYSAMPDTSVLAFDPNFVRKHQFYLSDSLLKPGWRPSHFAQDEEIGGLMEGSLAGLGFEFTRLQIAQSSQDFGISEDIDIAPSILFGIRQMRSELRTDRSQAYVALATRLGRSLLSLPEMDEPLETWIEGILTSLVSQKRLEEMKRRRIQTGPESASGVLSRSELFLLGQAFFNSKEWSPRNCLNQALCPVLEKLYAIVPNFGSMEYNAFQNEVNQYGSLLHSRIGISGFSFDGIDSYERLEKNLRPQYLYDRMCDLKIRIAELNYVMGLPASLGEIEGNLALDEILPPVSQTSAGNWKYTVDKINGLTEEVVLGWINQLIVRGSLSTEIRNPDTPGL